MNRRGFLSGVLAALGLGGPAYALAKKPEAEALDGAYVVSMRVSKAWVDYNIGDRWEALYEVLARLLTVAPEQWRESPSWRREVALAIPPFWYDKLLEQADARHPFSQFLLSHELRCKDVLIVPTGTASTDGRLFYVRLGRIDDGTLL